MDLTSLAYHLHRSVVGDVLRKTRTHDGARTLYKTVEYRANGGVFALTVSNREMQYRTASKAEYGTLRHLAVTERAFLTDFAAELTSTDTVYDIGAHLGLYTVLAEQFSADGEVVAFELATPNAERLAGMTGAQTTVVERAVSDESGKPYDSFEHRQPGIVSAAVCETDDSDSKRTITIDDYANDHRQPNVLKIDVEGHEQAVLDGGVETLSDDRCRAVYLEVHGRDERETITNRLFDLGFDSTEVLNVRETETHLKARRD